MPNTPEIRVEHQPPRRVLFLRHIGPYKEVGPTFQKLVAYAVQKGLFGPDILMIGIGHDNPDVVPAEKFRYDAAITVSENVTAEGEFDIQTLAGGEYAIATHRGPYDSLAESYRHLFGVWLPASGRQGQNAPPFEVYRNNPMNTKPEDLLTEIFLLLSPK